MNRWLASLSVALGVLHSAVGVAAEERVVSLPPFIVENARRVWLHGETPGCEVLSCCDERTTRRIVESRTRLERLLTEVLPETLQFKTSLPTLLILFDREPSKEAADAMVAQLLGAAGRASARYRVLPNIRLTDGDEVILFMVAGGDVRSDQLMLTTDHVRWLMRGRLPALPTWFVTGMLSLFPEVRFEGNQLSLRPMGWISVGQIEELRDDRRNTVALTPLLYLFTEIPPEGSSVSVRRRWQAQSELFVRWGLCSDNRAHREAMWRFAERSAADGFSEALFQECFGMDVAAVERAVRAFTPRAVQTTQTMPAKRDAGSTPLVLREAKPEELARIKGEFERLGYSYVKTISPELAPKYLEQARRTMRRAASEREPDPRLLMALGLCEVDGGNDAGARDYLENALAKTKALRPRAAVELARLRYAGLRAQQAAEARWSAEQMERVLGPLAIAFAQQPPLAGTYDLLAEAWSNAAVLPTREQLAVLEQGVALFPRRVDLVWRVAELEVRCDSRREAATLIAHGLRIVQDEAMEKRFLDLRERLMSSSFSR